MRWGRAAAAAAIGVGVGGAVAVTMGPYGDPEERAGSELPIPPDERPRAAVDAPDVVLVLACTLRRDQLTPYGGPPEASPFLARLAADGARFDDVIAAAPWTKASSTALLTGRHPVTVGMVDPGHDRDDRALALAYTTLAERMVGLGYETIGLTANPNLNRVYGLPQGFDAYRDSDGRIAADKVGGDELVGRALELVGARRHPERPLFLQVMLADAHEPRSATPEERAAFPGATREHATYLAEVRHLDDALARLEEELAASGVADPLWVVVADHGEGLDLAPGHRGHGKALYESVTRVPWLVAGPGVARGRVIRGLASGIDLVPTVLGLLGAPVPSTSSPHEGGELPGRDWSALVRGHGDVTDRTRALSDTWFYEVRRTAIFTPDSACTKDFLPRADPGLYREGCFDRRADPDWLRARPDAALMDELIAWREGLVREGEGVGAEVGGLEAGMREQLEALGYAE